MRTLLILVDGMRPDALTDIPYVRELMKRSAYTMNARTVFPSITLPVHVSLFHSVDPERHGTTTNTYAPQVRPINGLCEVIKQRGKRSAFFYGWEQLRDLSRPGSLNFSYFCSDKPIGWRAVNDKVTEMAISYLGDHYTDFAFLYLGCTDWAGHKFGWMSETYMEEMRSSWENIAKVLRTLPEDYTVIITADHGGHDRSHGSELPEDMTIPMFVLGKDIDTNLSLEGANIKDVAPTIVKLLGIEPDEDWEGKSVL